MDTFDINLLIIEDDHKIRSSIARTLKIKIKNIFEAENPRAALEVLKNHKIDLIISDIEMPEMDGLTFVETLRKSNFNMPVIITSAYTSPDYFKKAIDLRIDKYITKPVKIQDLFEAIEMSYNRMKNEELRTKNTLLEEKIFEYQSRMSTIGEMVGNISHQWRQPLTTISTVLTELKFMKELGDLSDELLTEDIAIIQKNINQMSETMDDFRELIMGDKKVEDFNLTEHINQVINICKAIIVTNFIKIEFKHDEDIIISNLKNALSQSMINIINNAKDALLDTNEDDRFILIDVQKNDENVIINIKDTAGGIDSENLNQVFDVLFTTKEDTGTGIGLYMTKKMITEKMNGQITVNNETFTHENKEYTGAVFSITLPL